MRGSVARLLMAGALLVAGCDARRPAEKLAGPPIAPTAPTAPTALTGPTWFSEAQSTGIDFQHVTGCTEEKPFPAANGSGIGVLDFDRDGWEDLYFLTGTPFPIDAGRTEPFNRLYRNTGALQFVEATTGSHTGYPGYSAGVAVGDYDNDGFPDIYLSCYGPNCLLHNLGDGTFEQVQLAAGVADDKWGTSAAFFDADRDGQLDLYVANYAKWSLETNQFCGDRQRKVRVFCGPNTVEPEPDVYYHNQGDGTFRRATEEVGLVGTPGRGQGVVAADVNGDGWIDIYVTNDLNANLLYVNRGDGTFRDISEASGTAYDHLGTRQAGMGVDAADYNEDGRLDLFVTNYEDEHNTLYENMGSELFQDVSQQRGITLASLPWIGWGTSLSDFDFDGWLDLIVTNGHVDDNRHLLGQHASYEQPGLLWRGNGRRFEPVGAEAGDYFAAPHAGRALVTADLDRDGDLDVVIGHQDRRPAVLRNNLLEQQPEARWCRVELTGHASNRDAVGARLILSAGERRQHRALKGGGSYLSQSSQRQVLALPAGAAPWSLEVVWPDGRRELVGELEPGRTYRLHEAAAVAANP